MKADYYFYERYEVVDGNLYGFQKDSMGNENEDPLNEDDIDELVAEYHKVIEWLEKAREHAVHDRAKIS